MPSTSKTDERSWTRPPDGDLARLRDRIAELERRNEELDRFAAAVAHELREPLISIEGYAGLITERLSGAVDEFDRDGIEALVRGTTRMRLIIDTLLRHARSGAGPPLREKVELEQVARDCLAVLRHEIASRGAEVEVEPLPVVTGDAALLSSVLQNLLVNALHYGPREGGTIHVTAARRARRWRICVESAGIPIGPADRSRIFSPFRRGRSERRADGIGLGLAICRSIVEEHGGTIGVQPLESGNRFFFTLPD